MRITQIKSHPMSRQKLIFNKYRASANELTYQFLSFIYHIEKVSKFSFIAKLNLVLKVTGIEMNLAISFAVIFVTFLVVLLIFWGLQIIQSSQRGAHYFIIIL